MPTMHDGPLEGYQPPPEQNVPDDWTYRDLDGQEHRYVREPGGDWQYRGATEAELPSIVSEPPAPFEPDLSNMLDPDAPDESDEH